MPGGEVDVHALIGGGKVANVLLWRDKRLSGTIFIGITAVWLLFSVAEYNLLTLLCHISIAIMLVVFIWVTIAKLIGINIPEIPQQLLSERAFLEAARAFHDNLNSFLSLLHTVSHGEDLKLFLVSIAALWLISELGSTCTTVNLLYIGYLCAQTLPFVYDQYEEEIARMLKQGWVDLQQLFTKLDVDVLSRIPRGPGAPSRDVKKM